MSDNSSHQKITIAHIMPWSGVGGVEIATLRMTEATRDRFRHVGFCLPDAVALRNSFEQLGIETVIYAAPEPSLKHGLNYYQASRALAQQLRSAGADIVHFSEIKGAYHSSLAARLANARIICHVRNTYPAISLRERLPLSPVHSFIFVSVEAQRNFGYPVPDSRSRVIYDAIEIPQIDIDQSNVDVRLELGIPTDCTVVGMVARVNPQKDYFTLANAAAEVLRKHPSTRFLVVGDNSSVEMNREHYEQVVQRLDELKIRESFIFTGYRKDVSRLIAAMDIGVLSTHREGFGLCVAETMALQKPVVATAVGGLLDFVQDGVTGCLHQHENSTELAAAITALIEDPEKARRIGAAGYDYVRRNYGREKFVEEITSAYADLMPQSPSHRQVTAQEN
jgi:glycosyltransferase involved in cell wall biosynthesis